MLKKPNTIYLSNALQKQLHGICEYPLTSVVAPMAYGKTTAISWFLDKCAKIPGTKVLRINVYSDAPPLFWQSIQRAFAHAGLDVRDADVVVLHLASQTDRQSLHKILGRAVDGDVVELLWNTGRAGQTRFPPSDEMLMM